MAAAIAMLIVLPALAGNGTKFSASGDGLLKLTASVYDNAEGLAVTASDPVEPTDPEDTKLGNTLYASNSDEAFNKILVQFFDDAGGPATITVDVDADNGSKVQPGNKTLVLTLSTDNKTYQGFFFIIKEGTSASDSIIAGHSDVVTVEKGSLTLDIVVDAKGPVITETLPAHKTLTTKSEATFTGTITDVDSGMRPDTEDPDGSPGGSDDDGDGVVTEPLTNVFGASIDIDIVIGLDDEDDGSSGTNQSTGANSGWTEVEKDHAYSFSFKRTGLDNDATAEGDVFWHIAARDRAGNETTTDVDDEKPLIDNFKITIDDEEPTFDTVQTGIGFDEDDRKEVRDSNAIKVVFKNDESNLPDPLDSDTIIPSDFVVVGHTVVSVIHPDEDDDKSLDGSDGDLDTTNIVYLILADELDPDEEPVVQMLAGAILDIAGNSNVGWDEPAADNIAPTLTVTITGLDGDGNPNNVDGRMITNDEFIVRVESDEELENPPRVFFVLIQFDVDDEAKQTIEEVEPTSGDSISSDGTNAWEETYDFGDVPGHSHSDLGGAGQTLFGVIVTAEDASDQTNDTATDGWDVVDDGLTPADLDAIDVPDMQDAGLLGELDDEINTVNKGELIPNTGEVDETESRNPFISLRFTESDEFRVQDATLADDQATLTDGDDRIDVDSHNTVTITKIELDGEDVSGQLLRAEKDEFSLALINLAEGDYKLVYTAVDDVGNELEDVEFKFEVVQRSEYKVALRPGWNLISLPGTPADPSIGSVLPDSMRASTILQWVDGAFDVNERQSDGSWDPSGGVTEVVAGPGYWILTNAFEEIETLIPERSPATVLPTIPIVGGWNLIGVIDLAQTDAGKDLPDTDKEGYMASIDELVVYGFDTETNTFAKVGDGDPIVVGSGYWVWADKKGTLVP